MERMKNGKMVIPTSFLMVIMIRGDGHHGEGCGRNLIII